MTPKQIEIARRAMALPGAPCFRPSGLSGVETASNGKLARRAGGILWLEVGSTGRVPDLADPTGATDGVLLRLLGPGWTVWNRPDGTWSLNKSFDAPVVGATLAEACCLAANALGRWPGGAL